MQLVIATTGSVRCVYDELLDLSSLGQIRIARGSHVEPDAEGNWSADLGPVSGPRLGPYGKRSEALAAETEWLDRNWLSISNAQNSLGRSDRGRLAHMES